MSKVIRLFKSLTRRNFNMRLIIIITFLLLSGCSSDTSKDFSWEKVVEVKNEEVMAKIQSWQKISSKGGFTAVISSQEYPKEKRKIAIGSIWRKLTSTTSENMRSELDFWYNNDNETVVICKERACTDVSAWYKLAHQEDVVLPQKVHAVTPGEAASYAELATYFDSISKYYLELARDSSDSVNFFSGERSEMGKRESCVGWVNAAKKYYLCATIDGVISSSSTGFMLNEIFFVKSYSKIRPLITDDIYELLPRELDQYFLEFGVFDKRWLAQHRVSGRV